MWWKNLIFILLCLAGGAGVTRQLLTRPAVPHPAAQHPVPETTAELQEVVDRLDAAFAHSWREAGLEPAPQADSLLVARRLSLALTGTIPSLQEIRGLETVPRAETTQWWLSHLFGDQRYSDYLAERFARILVGVENGPFLVYRRRRLANWLGDVFHANQPYDRMVRDLIASEGVWTTHPEVNFITVTIDQNNDKEGPDERKLAARVTRAFLGVRIDCVQCHDDKFGDRWKQRDFHQLAAFFSGAEMSLTGVRDSDKAYHYRYLRQPEEEEVPAVVPFEPELLPEEGTRRQRLAEWVTHPHNKAFARTTVNRFWALLFNQPLVEPIDDIPLEGPYPPGLDLLAEDFIRHDFDLQRLIRVIAASRPFQLASRASPSEPPLTPAHYEHFAAFPLSRLRPEQVAGSVIQSASLQTIDAESHILFRFARASQQNEFIQRYGDIGEDEFAARGGTIPQRLLLMNGRLVEERTKDDLVMNAAPRIAKVAPTDEVAVETAYLSVLSRPPTPAEQQHFIQQLEGTRGKARAQAMQDLYWSLVNATEFSWNH